MGLIFGSSNNIEDIDYDKLGSDLVDECGAQMASFSGGLGFCDMCDARNAPNDELISIAKREGIDLRKYRI